MKKVLDFLRMGALMGALALAVGACNDNEQSKFDPSTVPVAAMEQRLPDGGDIVNYYWSGEEKIWVETNYSAVMIGFATEEQATAFAATLPNVTMQLDATRILAHITTEEVWMKVLAEESATNKIYAHTFSGYENAPFWMTGEIVMKPKTGVSPQDILDEFEIETESVEVTDIGVIVMLKKWNTLLATSNAIYESGLVEWCHPNFTSRHVLF
jgi:hypothetical protein